MMKKPGSITGIVSSRNAFEFIRNVFRLAYYIMEKPRVSIVALKNIVMNSLYVIDE